MQKWNTPCSIALFLITLACPTVALAQDPGPYADPAESRTSLSVSGTVRGTFTRPDITKGNSDRTEYVFELEVSDAGTHKETKAGQLVYLRGWKSAKGGLLLVPAEGQAVTAHFQKARDGGLDLVIPNGFAAARGP